MEDQRNQKLNKTIFIDADIFVASVRTDDTSHTPAKDLYQTLEGEPVTFVTSNYVFAEAVTVISQRVSHAAAIEFAHTVRSAQSPIRILWLDEAIAELALDIFAQQTSKNVSFVDCTTMALAERSSIDYIFSFDKVFKQRGYHLVQELVEHRAA
jgi:predicted nucleic acid-binding protein